jgi:hypothetical protein
MNMTDDASRSREKEDWTGFHFFGEGKQQQNVRHKTHKCQIDFNLFLLFFK